MAKKGGVEENQPNGRSQTDGFCTEATTTPLACSHFTCLLPSSPTRKVITKDALDEDSSLTEGLRQTTIPMRAGGREPFQLHGTRASHAPAPAFLPRPTACLSRPFGSVQLPYV